MRDAYSVCHHVVDYRHIKYVILIESDLSKAGVPSGEYRDSTWN